MEVEIVDAKLSKKAYSNLEDTNGLKLNTETSPTALVVDQVEVVQKGAENDT